MAALVAVLFWYTGESGGSIAEALLVRPADVRFYRRAIERLTGRGGGRAAMAAAGDNE
jgi:hypothetical protein